MITVSNSGICPSNSKGGVFINLAGDRSNEKDDQIANELIAAGIDVERHEWLSRRDREVKTCIAGKCGQWWFERAWYYWVATGPGIPPQYANKLHRSHGKSVRVGGDCGCQSPFDGFKGFAVGLYHVDTPDGLKALADVIKAIMAIAEMDENLCREG